MRRERTNSSPGTSSDQFRIESKARLLDSLPDPMFLVAANCRVLAVNERVSSAFNVIAEEVIGTPLSEVLSLVDSEGSTLDIETSINRVFESGQPQPLEAWHTLDRQESQLRKVAVSVLLAPSSANELDCVAVVVRDESAEPAYAVRDAVISMVSHELRTPLLHIKGFVSTLLESDIQWDEETQLDFLRTIDREADRLTSTVSDLLEITRMGSGDLPLHLEHADPYLLAYAAIDSASPFVRKHRVLVEIPEDLPRVQMDVLRITGVLVNLLENAAKYSEEGSRIVINASTTKSNVTFSVNDQGLGISRDARDRIFEMFFRGERMGTNSSGTGLGLAVCKSVVDAHKGKIWVESEPGVGSTFYFRIPLEQAPGQGEIEPTRMPDSVRTAMGEAVRIDRKSPDQATTKRRKRRRKEPSTSR